MTDGGWNPGDRARLVDGRRATVLAVERTPYANDEGYSEALVLRIEGEERLVEAASWMAKKETG